MTTISTHLTQQLTLLSAPFLSANRKGQILASLVTQGDRQVMAALRPYQSSWDEEVLRSFSVSVRIETLQLATLDSCLIWLKQLIETTPLDDRLDRQASLVASALTRMVMQTGSQPLVDRCPRGEDCYLEYDDVMTSLSPLLTTLCDSKNPEIVILLEALRNPDHIPQPERTATDSFRNSIGLSKETDRLMAQKVVAIPM